MCVIFELSLCCSSAAFLSCRRAPLSCSLVGTSWEIRPLLCFAASEEWRPCGPHAHAASEANAWHFLLSCLCHSSGHGIMVACWLDLIWPVVGKYLLPCPPTWEAIPAASALIDGRACALRSMGCYLISVALLLVQLISWDFFCFVHHSNVRHFRPDGVVSFSVVI